MEHTKRQWKAWCKNGWHVSDGNDLIATIAEDFDIPYDGCLVMAEANARLIAAAPRMYTELEAGVAIIDGFRRGEEMGWDALDVWWRGAKAATAEATGE